MDIVKTAALGPDLRSLYRKRSLDWRRGGRTLHLDVPVDVFSSFRVDTGTQRLLRRIGGCGRKWGAALDLGCGYGPIGLHLAAAGLAERVDAIDRDALAVDFTAHNARRNGLSQVAARGAIAYEHLPPAAYDAVVMNLPAKAGRRVHELMLLGAARHLRAEGEVWVVAVQPLQDALDEILSVEAVIVREKTARKGHVIYNYSFSAEPPVPAEPYVRARMGFQWKGWEYSMTSLHGLGEFDSRSWATDLMLEVFRQRFRGKEIRSLLVCNPGQGHVAVPAWRIAEGVEEIVAVSRDLIALKATCLNLRGNDYGGALRCVHSADLCGACDDASPEVALARLNEKETLAVNVEKLRRLLSACDGCRAIVGCKSAFASRLRERLRAEGIRASLKKKRKGFCSMVLE
jgi:16S rRNA (guanine1207-N2)-methyltransferase